MRASDRPERAGACGRIRRVNLLALESSTEVLSVAALAGGELVERRGEGGRSHSDVVLPLVREVLGEAGLALSALDAIVFGSGPGSFTGLRLACGVAQGLAFAADLPVLAVSSLEALACGAGEGGAYVCVDARMNEVYCAAYDVVEGIPEVVLGPVVAPPQVVPVPRGGLWLGCGSGFAAHDEVLRARLGQALRAVDAGARPSASALARLAVPRVARGEAGDAALALPLYVRDKVALTTAERLARAGAA